MRKVAREMEFSRKFGKDFERELKGKHSKTIADDLDAITSKLSMDTPLPAANKDHPLAGDWAGYRDCHVHPDLVLLYSKPMDKAKNRDLGTLILVRLGSHAELF